ncbi:MAG: carboxypeptidase regulatory-like domain-containing protein [Paludibacteraceae bacterium]|nr:carboxypeptidase regulatory-like domain-containing protein [Paludibacteraceae bacterium]
MKKFLLYCACTIYILLTFTSCENDKPRKGIVTFYGTVTDQYGEPFGGVEVKIGGSDTSGGSTITGSDGTYELPVTVIPTEKSNTMTFVLVADVVYAYRYAMGSFEVYGSDAAYVGKDYLSYVAYAHLFKIGWQVVGERVHHSFRVGIKYADD